MVFVNSLQGLQVNPGLSSTVGCLKCILGINLSPTNKNLLFHLFYTFKNKIPTNIDVLLLSALQPKLLNNWLASSYLINLDFLLLQTTHAHKSIILPLLVLETLGFIFSLSFLHFKQYHNIVIIYSFFL